MVLRPNALNISHFSHLCYESNVYEDNDLKLGTYYIHSLGFV